MKTGTDDVEIGKVTLNTIDQDGPWATLILGGKSYQINAYALEGLLEEHSEAIIHTPEDHT